MRRPSVDMSARKPSRNVPSSVPVVAPLPSGGAAREVAASGCQRILHQPLQVRLRVIPRIALVADVAEEHGERGAFALGIYVLEASQEGRDVGTRRHVGEEASHLDLGIDAGTQAAVALEDQRLAEHRQRIDLLERGMAHRLGERRGERIAHRGQPGGVRVHELAAVDTLRVGAGDPLRDRAHEAVVPERVVEDPHARLLANAGERAVRKRRKCGTVAGLPGERQRQRIRPGAAVVEGDIGDREEPRVVRLRPFTALADADRAQRGTFRPEPALARKHLRQHVALELLAYPSREDRRQPRRNRRAPTVPP